MERFVSPRGGSHALLLKQAEIKKRENDSYKKFLTKQKMLEDEIENLQSEIENEKLKQSNFHFRKENMSLRLALRGMQKSGDKLSHNELERLSLSFNEQLKINKELKAELMAEKTKNEKAEKSLKKQEFEILQLSQELLRTKDNSKFVDQSKSILDESGNVTSHLTDVNDTSNEICETPLDLELSAIIKSQESEKGGKGEKVSWEDTNSYLNEQISSLTEKVKVLENEKTEEVRKREALEEQKIEQDNYLKKVEQHLRSTFMETLETQKKEYANIIKQKDSVIAKLRKGKTSTEEENETEICEEMVNMNMELQEEVFAKTEEIEKLKNELKSFKQKVGESLQIQNQKDKLIKSLKIDIMVGKEKMLQEKGSSSDGQGEELKKKIRELEGKLTISVKMEKNMEKTIQNLERQAEEMKRENKEKDARLTEFETKLNREKVKSSLQMQHMGQSIRALESKLADSKKKIETSVSDGSSSSVEKGKGGEGKESANANSDEAKPKKKRKSKRKKKKSSVDVNEDGETCPPIEHYEDTEFEEERIKTKPEDERSLKETLKKQVGERKKKKEKVLKMSASMRNLFEGGFQHGPIKAPISLDDITKEYIEIEKAWRPILKSRKNFSIARSPKNAKLNRYTNILPYNHNVVRLGSGRYINASEFTLHDIQYVVTQWPLRIPVDHIDSEPDFWEMVYQKDCRLIVCLQKLGRHEHPQYWPKNKVPKVYGKNYTVQFLKRVDNRYLDIYTLHIHKKKKFGKKKTAARELNILLFKCWPDHHVPEDFVGFYDLVKTVNMMSMITKRPIVVHCSAGIGRTGVFIAVQNMLKSRLTHADTYETLHELRKQRFGMVQNIKQYQFIIDVMYWVENRREKNALAKSMEEKEEE